VSAALSPPHPALASPHAGARLLRPVNAAELFTAIASLPGSQAAGGQGNGIAAGQVVNGVEYARATALDETKLRATHRKRQAGGATPLVVVTDDPDAPGLVRVLGPQKDGPVRRVRAESLLGLVQRTVSLSGCSPCASSPRRSSASTPSASPA
jgi:hypothetical protein